MAKIPIYKQRPCPGIQRRCSQLSFDQLFLQPVGGTLIYKLTVLNFCTFKVTHTYAFFKIIGVVAHWQTTRVK